MNWFYCRFIYRRLMEIMHRHGIHKMRTFWVGNDKHELCDWCGLRRVEVFDRLVPESWQVTPAKVAFPETKVSNVEETKETA